MFAVFRRKAKKIPLKSPTEWLDEGGGELYRQMRLAGCTSFDGFGYCIFETQPEEIRNLYAAFNAYLARNRQRRLFTDAEMYSYAASYGESSSDMWEYFNTCGEKLCIKKGLLAHDHPTRDEYAPPLPPSDPVREFNIPSAITVPRIQVADLANGHRLFMTVDESVRSEIAETLGGKDLPSCREITTRYIVATDGPITDIPHLYASFWVEDSSMQPVMAFFRNGRSKVKALLPGNRGWWTDDVTSRRASRPWYSFDIMDEGWTFEEFIPDYGSLPPKSHEAFIQLRGLFRQLGDEQTWLRLMIAVNPSYGFSDYDRALAMRSYQTAEHFAEKVLRGRWIEYENQIIGNPAFVISYAKKVLLRSGYISAWPEGEAEIIRLGDPWEAIEYALRIRRRRWEEAEALLGDTGDTAWRYAKEMMKGKFERGEEVLANICQYAHDYAFLTGERFLPGEKTIKKVSKELWKEYVKRFPKAA